MAKGCPWHWVGCGAVRAPGFEPEAELAVLNSVSFGGHLFPGAAWSQAASHGHRIAGRLRLHLEHRPPFSRFRPRANFRRLSESVPVPVLRVGGDGIVANASGEGPIDSSWVLDVAAAGRNAKRGRRRA